MHGVPGKCWSPLSGIRAETVTERSTVQLGPVFKAQFQLRQSNWDIEIVENLMKQQHKTEENIVLAKSSLTNKIISRFSVNLVI